MSPQYQADWSDEDDELDIDDESFDADDAPYDECPQCGAAIFDDAPQCPSCGSYVTFDRSVWSGKPGWWVLLGKLGVFAVIVALLGPAVLMLWMLLQ